MSEQIPREFDPVRWWDEHFDGAAAEILEFLAQDGITIEGRQVADIGCGDGTTDLGLVMRGRPERLVGYDVRPVDEQALARSAQAAEVADELPANLEFARSEPDRLPALDETFDVVVSWSLFEHVENPVALLGEIRRILKPDGVFLLQVFPFFLSEHGGHLWMHYDEAFPHLVHPRDEILARIEGRPGTDPASTADEEYRSLSRITLDELQRAMLTSGLVCTKLELITSAVHIPPRLANRRLADLGVSGVKLLAVPNR